MSTHHYTGVRYPWQARIDLRSPHPARFYGRLVSQAFRYGLPAARRGGPATAWFARRRLPHGLLTRAVPNLPRRDDVETDALIAAVTEEWFRLASTSSRLPERAPELTALVLLRAAARTIFLFGAGPAPLLIAKLPQGDGGGVDKEVAALQEIDAEGVAPRYLGRVGEARIQEAIPGDPLEVIPVSPTTASRVQWTPAHAAIATALETVARATVKNRLAEEVTDGLIDRAMAEVKLNDATSSCLQEALASLDGFETSVLKHGDTSAQNCLVDQKGAAYLVDWEGARTSGAPGFDVWNLALAYLEHGVGLKHWSQRHVLHAFRSSWHSPFFEEARVAARRACRAAGVGEAHLRPLEIAFFGRRVAHRVVRPEEFRTTRDTAVAMLEIVCAS